MDGPGIERQWFSNNDLDHLPMTRMQRQYNSLLYLCDSSFEDPDDVLSIESVSREDLEKMKQLSPLNTPGEWESQTRDDGGYEFYTDDVEITILLQQDGYVTRLDGPSSGSLSGVIGIDTIQEPLISEYWTAERIMERNPRGGSTKTPDDVEVPGAWELWQDLSNGDGHGPIAWINRETNESLRIRFSNGQYELVHQYVKHDDIPESVIARRDDTRDSLEDLMEKVEVQAEIRAKGARKIANTP